MQKLVSGAILLACAGAAFGQGDPTYGSIEQYQKILETNPRDAVAHYRIGEIHMAQKNYFVAMTEFQKALQGDSPPAWLKDSIRTYLDTIASSIGIYPIGSSVKAPEPASSGSLQVDYTDEARLSGVEGEVVVSGILGEDKALAGITVEKKLGLGLDERVMEAAAKWRHTNEAMVVNSVVRLKAEFLLPEKKSRWHLAGVEFQTPEGALRPRFSNVPYPIGAGITREAVDQGRFVVAVGRSASARLSFDIGTDGRPSNFKIVSQSEETWGPQAIGLVRQWDFQPGTKEGIAVTVPCIMTLVWGERSIPAAVLARVLRDDPSLQEAKTATTPEIRYQPDPSYSEEALAARQEGTVEIALVVSYDGTPRDLQVVQKVGYGLDERALEAVSKWRFAPAIVNGQPAAVRTRVKVPFRLPSR